MLAEGASSDTRRRSEWKELCGGQPSLRRSYFRFLLQEAQDNFASLRVTKREHVRTNGAEPIVNDMVSVLGSAWDNGHLRFHQAETKKSEVCGWQSAGEPRQQAQN